MANLIITVISIALVAVAALMGAYYGGEAYMQGQAKAKANEIVNAFEQVSAALQMFQANGSVLTYNLTASGYNYGSDLSQLVPSYIQQIPSVGVFGITLNPSFNHTSDKVFMFKLINYNSMKNGMLMTYVAQASTCKQLEAIRTGNVPTSLRTYSDWSGVATDYIGTIGCLYDAANGWTGGANAAYIAYYAPFGPPY